ncbi:unnamed protein product [Gongylonema pulchrum]|uniref:histone acetyltransferase n=1 Tax=Gongylonema pulchrum TaxID=637853 RepID=A0A183DIS4_9BILA|nr:unnamed protein product [Gongylonema pulchrum]VDK63883.1 unnamed protein product [Gongylonema pulchrum]
MAYFWACPPAESDDYIFNRHPPEQKIPKAKNLENWYKRLLEKGLQEHIVYNYKNIYRQAKQDNLLTPMALPYFEGDFWPTSIENCIGDVSYKDSPVAKKRQKSISGEDGGDNIACVGNSTAITRKHRCLFFSFLSLIFLDKIMRRL